MTALGQVLIAFGVGLILVSALGVLRLPDAYARANAVSKAGGLGVCAVLLGAATQLPTSRALVLVTAVAFQVLTVPVAGYAVARAAHRSGTPMWPGTRSESSPGDGALPAAGKQGDLDVGGRSG